MTRDLYLKLRHNDECTKHYFNAYIMRISNLCVKCNYYYGFVLLKISRTIIFIVLMLAVYFMTPQHALPAEAKPNCAGLSREAPALDDDRAWMKVDLAAQTPSDWLKFDAQSLPSQLSGSAFLPPDSLNIFASNQQLTDQIDALAKSLVELGIRIRSFVRVMQPNAEDNDERTNAPYYTVTINSLNNLDVNLPVPIQHKHKKQEIFESWESSTVCTGPGCQRAAAINRIRIAERPNFRGGPALNRFWGIRSEYDADTASRDREHLALYTQTYVSNLWSVADIARDCNLRFNYCGVISRTILIDIHKYKDKSINFDCFYQDDLTDIESKVLTSICILHSVGFRVANNSACLGEYIRYNQKKAVFNIDGALFSGNKK